MSLCISFSSTLPFPLSSMSTVTRRRVAGQSSNSDDDNSNQSSAANNNTSTEKKIAYDPRDIDERNSTPKLTLMEEVLLLGLKDKQVTPINRMIHIHR